VAHLGQALYDADPKLLRPHLWIVITDPAVNPQSVVMVSISSVRRGRTVDKACILCAQAHEQIRHESFASYARAQVFTAEQIDSMISKGLYSTRTDVNEYWLNELREGLLRSQHALNKHKEILREEQRRRLEDDSSNEELPF